MLVSVLMPTYNHQDFIQLAIDGFLAQQCDFPTELIICDDCSTDNTPEIAIRQAAMYPEKIIFLQKKRNDGLLENYKTLLRTAKGKYCAILESDDRWCDQLKLRKQVDFMEAHGDYGLCHTYAEVIDESNTIKSQLLNHYDDSDNLYSNILLENHIIAPTVCFRKSLFDTYCNIDDYITLGFKTFDYPVWLALAAHSKFHCIQQVTTQYRILNNSISNTSDFDKRLDFAIGISRILDHAIAHFGPGQLTLKQIENRKTMLKLVAALELNRNKELHEWSTSLYPISAKSTVIKYLPLIWAGYHHLKKSFNTLSGRFK